MLNRLLRILGLIRETVEHVENDFFAIATRFEAVAEKQAKIVEKKAEEIAAASEVQIIADQARARAAANASKVRSFFKAA